MKIGILALQGAFIEHRQMLAKLDTQSFEIRQRSDLDQNPDLDGLIIPGGESTTMAKLLAELDLMQPLRAAIQNGLPTFGTCAGMILLSKGVTDSNQHNLDALDTTVRRNAFGRQLGSFYTTTQFADIGQVPATFIRAPYVEAVHTGNNIQPVVEILATVGDKIVAVRQGKVLATAFHPELSTNTKVHESFLALCV